MNKITKKATLEFKNDGYPHRIHLGDREHPALKTWTKGQDYIAALNFPFRWSLKEYGFTWPLFRDTRKTEHQNKLAVRRLIKTEEEYSQIERWIEERRGIVILRDCLTASAALSLRLVDNQKTQISQWVYAAKFKKVQTAIDGLVKESDRFLHTNPSFKQVDYICAIPAHSSKLYDLSRELAKKIGEKEGLEDITPCFTFEREKEKLQNMALESKWDALEKARITIEKNLTGKAVLLIDDTYQSGITMQFAAMLLQEKGANKVYGLAMRKTMSDTDNQD